MVSFLCLFYFGIVDYWDWKRLLRLSFLFEYSKNCSPPEHKEANKKHSQLRERYIRFEWICSISLMTGKYLFIFQELVPHLVIILSNQNWLETQTWSLRSFTSLCAPGNHSLLCPPGGNIVVHGSSRQYFPEHWNLAFLVKTTQI